MRAMTWAEAIAKIDPNEKAGLFRYTDPVWEADMDAFYSVLELSRGGWFEAFGHRVTKHWVTSWICTDTRVGIAIYCMEGEPIATSMQPARKSDEVIRFLSYGAAERVRAFILELQGTPEVPLADTTEEINVQYVLNAGGNWGYRR